VTPRSQRLAAVVFATSLASFVAVAVAVVTWESAAQRDVQFVRWVHSSAPDALIDGMRVLTYAGSVFLLGPLMLVGVVFFIRRRRRTAAVLVLLALVGSLLVDEVLKAGFRRARPEFEDPFVQLTTYAFPSGHAFGAAAAYGALALAIASVMTTRRERALAFLAAASIVLIVAASRVILGVHYVSDVLAGVAAGVALVSGLALVLARTGRQLLGPVRRDQETQSARFDT